MAQQKGNGAPWWVYLLIGFCAVRLLGKGGCSSHSRTPPALSPPLQAPPVYVSPYDRTNGTRVPGHYRTYPDGNPNNNWSTYPNVNPYTGVQGSRRR